ncbi:hypothetical protein ILUMI_13652 [Ignelater luminosus]|uniref:Transposase Tc1-like domain-containing protein n=1 Tax=Ignelater luminosus TaxID=2038154 RepID=A0A8K0CRZ7_IGNLU|nr:hypothetical protein ILUMI_13652 [Ignelater luminosus]
MPKVAQSFSGKLRSWIALYNIKEELFTTNGKVQELEKTNHTTVARFINDNLKQLFGEYHFEDKLLLMTSDAVPYMAKVFKSLEIFYSNIIYVTGIVHGLNRIAEKVRELCLAVNILINNRKKMFLKASTRVDVYRSITNARLLPNPVATKWGTWLQAAIFYSDNFVKFKVVMQNLEEDAASVTKVKALLSETAIVKELALIKSYIKLFPDVMEALETRGMTLKDQLEKLSFVEEKLKIIPRKEEKVLQQKFENISRDYLICCDMGVNLSRPGTGRKRYTTESDDRFIVSKSLRNRRLIAVQVQRKLREVRGVNISQWKVKRRLQESNLTPKDTATGPKLTPVHRQTRLSFARDHLNLTLEQWGNALFSDETRICLYGSVHA